MPGVIRDMKVYGSRLGETLQCRYGCCGNKLARTLKNTLMGIAARKAARKRARREARRSVEESSES
jgi:hypothetical protein